MLDQENMNSLLMSMDLMPLSLSMLMVMSEHTDHRHQEDSSKHHHRETLFPSRLSMNHREKIRRGDIEQRSASESDEDRRIQ